jgi:nucleotide-binding universal stress UspA family protein
MEFRSPGNMRQNFMLSMWFMTLSFSRGWNLPMPSLHEEYKKVLNESREELHTMINSEKKKGMSIKELVKEGDPEKEIFKAVRDERIDLIVMLAHEEGHLEHFLFGRSNEEIIRKMPCSVLLVKKEPEPPQ